MLKAVAIDDEPIALEVIRNLSAKVSYLDMKGYFTNALEAIGFLQSNDIDLLFLDIKMPDISGIDFLKAIPKPPLVIFTTAYSEHAVESFELDAIDYLLKPFSLTRFLKACNKANEQYLLRTNNVAAKGTSPVFIKSGYEQVKVNLDDVLYVEGSGNYVQFVLEGRKIASRLTMSEAEALLPAADFIRIHRSYIVSRKHIHKIDRRNVWVQKTELPIGAAYAKDIDNDVRIRKI